MMPEEILYPHEQVIAWIKYHFFFVVFVVTLVVGFSAVLVANKILNMVLGTYPMMQPYNSCDMGPPP